ncbi:hypothetical protein [Pseudomonas putida]|uniref:hypothetical protein n=1 Tax=Pseudomonas putida TaxID=303 RepID=UPI0012DB09E5|nr:hypothetical protein [Pseudomonas putida]
MHSIPNRNPTPAAKVEDAKKGATALTAQSHQATQPEFLCFYGAMPKLKTLAVFNEPGPTRQSSAPPLQHAASYEEGFIHDVLAQYTCYKCYYKQAQYMMLATQIRQIQEISPLGAAEARLIIMLRLVMISGQNPRRRTARH